MQTSDTQVSKTGDKSYRIKGDKFNHLSSVDLSLIVVTLPRPYPLLVSHLCWAIFYDV